MKLFAARYIAIALTTSTPLLAHCAEAKPGATARHSPKILGPVELLDVIKPGAKPLPPGIYKLSREWMGTLTTVGDEYKKNGLKPDAPELVRLNLLIFSKKGVSICSGRKIGSEVSCTLGFRLSPQVHTDDEILKNRDLFTLKSWFGRQHGATDGWSDGETTNWTEHWQFFALESDGTLRAQTIFAHASQRIGKRDEITPTKSMPPFVRIMNLRTCELRPVK